MTHYEKALSQGNADRKYLNADNNFSPSQPTIFPLLNNLNAESEKIDKDKSAEEMQTWLRRITKMQQQVAVSQANVLNISNNTVASNNHHPQKKSSSSRTAVDQSSNQKPEATRRLPMRYSDLPYMGEITLDNTKPRRGRKPKKADICHLIYKNYGTILPGTPTKEEMMQKSNNSDKAEQMIKEQSINEIPLPLPLAATLQRTDIQSRISSLLEKRLTQESRRGLFPDDNREQTEPLNLCIKDLNRLKIKLYRKQGNVYESDGLKGQEAFWNDPEKLKYLEETCNRAVQMSKTRPVDIEAELLSGISGSSSTEDLKFKGLFNDISPMSLVLQSPPDEREGRCSNESAQESSSSEAGLLYWPNSNVFIHPLQVLQSQVLYRQQQQQQQQHKQQKIVQIPDGETTPSLPGGIVDMQAPNKKQKIIPKSIFALMDNKVATSVENASGSASGPTTPATPCLSPVSPSPPKSRRNTPPVNINLPSPDNNHRPPSNSSTSSQPIKRKRSAIFIPPMPTENNNNPATEVSICKFKFTGGAKPSLQEKKSLSVDSGGNFRYYSGTGDKNMRGYEFFSREALQQPPGQSTSPAGVFLNAAGERIVSPTTRVASPSQEDVRRKRKTRKTLQREKLEQTFKEKGFLIQTQQLESAEGATYCKFRQLRKFTRYLFRSWKDYLPGNVHEIGEGVPPGGPDILEAAQIAGERGGDVVPALNFSLLPQLPAASYAAHQALPLGSNNSGVSPHNIPVAVPLSPGLLQRDKHQGLSLT